MVFCGSFFLLAIVLSVLRFKHSDYPFGIFKLFFSWYSYIAQSVWHKHILHLHCIALGDCQLLTIFTLLFQSYWTLSHKKKYKHASNMSNLASPISFKTLTCKWHYGYFKYGYKIRNKDEDTCHDMFSYIYYKENFKNKKINF